MPGLNPRRLLINLMTGDVQFGYQGSVSPLALLLLR